MNRNKGNHNCSTVCNTPAKAVRSAEEKKRWSSLDSRVSTADIFRASTRVHIVCFSQATVNDHRGGRIHDSWYICNEARVRVTYLSFTMAMGNGREDWSLGNKDWFFHRDFYLDIVCGNFLAAFAPIRRFGRHYPWMAIQLEYFVKLLSISVNDYYNTL